MTVITHNLSAQIILKFLKAKTKLTTHEQRGLVLLKLKLEAKNSQYQSIFSKFVHFLVVLILLLSQSLALIFKPREVCKL